MKEGLLLFSFLISTAIVIVLPIALSSQTWICLTWSALFGCIGSYVRYLLSYFDNSKNVAFPLGTFASNIAGTWLLAAITVISKFSVPFHDHTV